jgi:hypothetical protein
MSFYLVSATPRGELIDDLRERLGRSEFRPLQPFGRALTHALENARRAPGGGAIWEEEDYCTPPLAEERAAVLDRYFHGLSVETVAEGDGWRRIADLPALFPNLAGRDGG